MNTFLKAALAFIFIFSSFFTANAQCPGCVLETTTCPTSTQSAQACGSFAITATAGDTLAEDITFALPVSFVIRQGQPVPGFPVLPPPLPPFTAPFDINVFVDTVFITSVTGLPAGISWESDSSGNGNHYLPYVYQYGCMKFCGQLDCASTGAYTANINFSFKTQFSTSDPQFQALLDQTLGTGGVDNNETLTVTFNIDPSTNLLLELGTTGSTTVIDSGQTISLTATPGFDSYLWSTGDTTATLNVEPTDTTWYFVTATDTMGCTQTDSLEVQVLAVVDTVTNGITAAGYNSALLQVYPNPSQGSFNVSFAQPLKSNATVEVIDITGKVVYTGTLLSLNNTITLDAAKGLYLVKVITGDNIYTHKLLLH